MAPICVTRWGGGGKGEVRELEGKGFSLVGWDTGSGGITVDVLSAHDGVLPKGGSRGLRAG